MLIDTNQVSFLREKGHFNAKFAKRDWQASAILRTTISTSIRFVSVQIYIFLNIFASVNWILIIIIWKFPSLRRRSLGASSAANCTDRTKAFELIFRAIRYAPTSGPEVTSGSNQTKPWKSLISFHRFSSERTIRMRSVWSFVSASQTFKSTSSASSFGWVELSFGSLWKRLFQRQTSLSRSKELGSLIVISVLFTKRKAPERRRLTGVKEEAGLKVELSDCRNGSPCVTYNLRTRRE